jgi:ABC-2 type transport system ATP-binding protein
MCCIRRNKELEVALKVEGLAKNYGSFSLKKVGFTLPCGSIMGLIGENGAGKTTTIKLILNMIKKDGGRIVLLGRDAGAGEEDIKNDIGVVMEDSFFHDQLKPGDITKIMKLLYKKWDHTLFMRYLKRFSHPENASVKEYSKGMKMKLSIASALSHHPRLLILDEPAGGLDPVARSELSDIFLEFIQDEKNSILVSSHITSDMEKFADYITYIHDGGIVFSESKDTLMDDYGILKCAKDDFGRLAAEDLLGYRKSRFGCEVLVRNKREMERKYRGFAIDHTNIEEIMLFYAKGDLN